VDAVLLIVGKAAGGSEAVQSLVVHGDAQTRRQFDRSDVRNLLQAQFSAPYCLAVAATSGRATLDQFEPLRTGEPEVRRLMAATRIETDRVLGRTDYPSLEVVFKDGRREHLDIPFAKGAPEAPLPDDELVAKALSLLVPVIGGGRANQLVDQVWALERCSDLSQVTCLLAADEEASA
jgi:2-methylcitrate dehydratase PrpD